MNDSSHVRIESPAFAADSVQVVALEGRELLSQLFELHVQVVSTAPHGLDVDAVIGAPATLILERGGVETRRLGGLVAGIRDSLHEETGRMVYDLWFAPRAFRLGLVETYEIFMEVSIPDILRKKLERVGLQENEDYELRLTAAYPAREFVVQYKETDLAFVSRLAEHVGICFFFEHKKGKDVLVFSDHNSGFAPLVDGREVRFHKRGERRGVFALESHTRMTPAEYVVKDYNYRTPQVALRASSPTDRGDGGHVLEVGAHFKSADEGAQIARIRAEEVSAGRTIFEGSTDRHGFSAGATLLLEEHPRGDLELLVTEVFHRAATTSLGVGKEDQRDYEARFKAIPYKTPYRPQRLTPKPRIHGVITGVIDAAAQGPYAELDADGRYRVRFLFDPGEAGGGQASRLVRMAQPHGGGGYGMHFPLRSGVEVILTFVDGDPDRPIILGVVPNPQTPSPVTAGNGTRNVIRTGGGNEINMDDTGGGERIKLSSPYGKTVVQLGAPNQAESGLCVETDEHATHVAKQSWNNISATANLYADYRAVQTAKDIEHFCTPWLNWSAYWGAVQKGADSALGVAKGWMESWKEDRKKALTEHKEEQELYARNIERSITAEKAKLEQAEARRDAAQKRHSEATAAVWSNPPGTPEAPNPAADAAANELESAKGALEQADRDVESAKEQLAKLEQDSVDVASEAEETQEGLDRETSEENWYAKQASSVLDFIQGGNAEGTKLMNIASAHIGYLAEEMAWKQTESLTVAANNVVRLGRYNSPIGIFVEKTSSPAFIGGSLNKAALSALRHAVVGSHGRTTIYGGKVTDVLSGGLTTLKGKLTGIHGTNEIALTSDRKISATSKGEITGSSDGPMQLETKDALTLVGKSIVVRSTGTASSSTGKAAPAFLLFVEKGPTSVVAEKGDVELQANLGNVSFRAKQGTLTLEAETTDLSLYARKKAARLVLAEQQAQLAHGAFGTTMGTQGIHVGQLSNEKPLESGGVSVTSGHVKLAKGSTTLTCDGSGIVVKASSGFTVNSKRIDLD